MTSPVVTLTRTASTHRGTLGDMLADKLRESSLKPALTPRARANLAFVVGLMRGMQLTPEMPVEQVRSHLEEPDEFARAMKDGAGFDKVFTEGRYLLGGVRRANSSGDREVAKRVLRQVMDHPLSGDLGLERRGTPEDLLENVADGWSRFFDQLPDR